MKNPLVSIIMNCYNSETYLSESIQSVLNQSYKYWELIFWDNQSTDNSKNIFKSFHDKRLKYFFSPEHTSLGKARNLAINKSKGDIIAFLDCDDLWLPEKLNLQIPHFNNKDVGIVISDSIFFNNKKDIKRYYNNKPPPSGKVFSKLLAKNFISLETAIIRKRSLLEMSEWFDERFQVIEEYDLFVRMSYNWELSYVDKVLAKWRIHASSWTWKRPELFPYELRLFLEKMNLFIPLFETKYRNEVKAIKSQIKLQEAIIAWGKNGGPQARKILKSNHCINKDIVIIYIFTLFLPYSFFKFLNNLRVGLHDS